MALVVDPNTGRLVDEKELGKSKDQKDNKKDINQNLYKQTFDETELETPEQNNEVSGATAFAAGLGSGVIKTVEGVVSLGAELIDLGADTNTAAQVESFFDKINPLEELAEQRAIGRLTEALVQVGYTWRCRCKTCNNISNKSIKSKKSW